MRGFRSMLFVPLLRDGRAIGVISVTREEPGPFADHHVQLLQTFADQAVIAIENVATVRRGAGEDARPDEVAAAADRDRRRAQGDQPLGVRPADRARDAGRTPRSRSVRRRHGGPSASATGDDVLRAESSRWPMPRLAELFSKHPRSLDAVRDGARVLEGDVDPYSRRRSRSATTTLRRSCQKLRRLPHDARRSAAARGQADRRH